MTAFLQPKFSPQAIRALWSKPLLGLSRSCVCEDIYLRLQCFIIPECLGAEIKPLAFIHLVPRQLALESQLALQFAGRSA